MWNIYKWAKLWHAIYGLSLTKEAQVFLWPHNNQVLWSDNLPPVKVHSAYLQQWLTSSEVIVSIYTNIQHHTCNRDWQVLYDGHAQTHIHITFTHFDISVRDLESFCISMAYSLSWVWILGPALIWWIFVHPSLGMGNDHSSCKYTLLKLPIQLLASWGHNKCTNW